MHGAIAGRRRDRRESISRQGAKKISRTLPESTQRAQNQSHVTPMAHTPCVDVRTTRDRNHSISLTRLINAVRKYIAFSVACTSCVA